MSTGPVSRADQVAAAEWENHQLQQQARQQAAVAAANKQAQQDPNQSSIYSQPQQAHRAAASASEQHYRSLKYPSYDSASNYSLSQHQQRQQEAAAAYNRNSVYGYSARDASRGSLVDDRRSVIENPLLEEDEEEEDSLLPPPTFNNHGGAGVGQGVAGNQSQQLPPLPPPPPIQQLPQINKSRSIYSVHGVEAAANAISDAHERFHYRSPSYSKHHFDPKHHWHQEADSDEEEETGCQKSLDKIDWEEINFYVKVIVFGILVFLLPLTPMLMFVCTETSPSIHPDVLNYIKNVGNQGEGADDGDGGNDENSDHA